MFIYPDAGMLPLIIDVDLGPGILSRGEIVMKLRATSHRNHPRLPDKKASRMVCILDRTSWRREC